MTAPTPKEGDNNLGIHIPPSEASTPPTEISKPMAIDSHSTDSSESSRRFNLSPSSTSPILVYTVRSGSYHTSTESQLCSDLDKEPGKWRCSRKPISRSTARLNIQVRDLLPEVERKHATAMHYPNQTNSVASVGLPMGVRMRRMLFGQFQDLYILSPDSTSSFKSSGTGQSSSNGMGSNGMGNDTSVTPSPEDTSPEDENHPPEAWNSR
ncbi:MAG: hypothetical protein M1831_006366 [Alyxoria varia]|nr:MAG: hypothetical protein M1831_006366 [Alyxoria varia]